MTSAKCLSEIHNMLLSFNDLKESVDTLREAAFPKSFTSRVGPPCPLPEIITRRQIEILTVFANNDLSINEVGEVLHVSAVTVHQHIAAVRKACKVRTNQAAIKKAIANGWIVYY